MPGRIRPGVTAEAREYAKVQKAEAMFQKMMKDGKVTPSNIRKVKDQIAKKTGAYPMGDTN